MNLFFKNILKPIFVFCVFLCIVTNISFAQSKKELEEKKRRLRKEIEYTNKLLKETSQTERSTLNRLTVINKKIRNRNEIISTISNEIRSLDSKIAQNGKSIKSLETNLIAIKKEYADLIYHAYINRNTFERIMFVLAADNINQSYKRLKYLQQYGEYRKQQAKLLQQTKNKLDEQTKQLAIAKVDKQNLVKNKLEETQLLNREKEEQSQVVDNLKQREKQLLNKVSEQQAMEKKLEASIYEAIAEEEAIKKKARTSSTKGVAKTEAKTETKTEPKKNTVKTIDISIYTMPFSKSKGKLPWPLDNGVIVNDFGEQPHPYLKGVRVRNDGIDISTTRGADVYAVFDGVVSKVVTIPGANKTVLISHGDYYTIYSNLVTVSVTAGEYVKKLQKIGVVFTDVTDNNHTLLKFQIWNKSNKLNPALWLGKK